MSNVEITIYFVILGLLILLAAFFAAAETALMAINQYRLRHKARLHKRSAIRILRLLKRPDRLLGMILMVNTFSNILASALATLLAVHFFGDRGVIPAAFLLTMTILIFAEVAPKTVAALYPERVANFVSLPLIIVLKIFYPFVWFINVISNGFLRLLHVKIGNKRAEPLSREELRSVVYETAGRISSQYQNMLLGILDLNKVTVDDVMVPSHEILGIDLDADSETITNLLLKNHYDVLPIYRDSIDHIVGMLHIRDLTSTMVNGRNIDKELLEKIAKEPYFVPEGTPLNIQLVHFQQKRKRVAFVVDEYGDILGLLTLQDILEEIVGEFTSSVGASTKLQPQADGSFLVDGAMTIRELNKLTAWGLPTKGARTLNGLIIEYLESIPHPQTCIKIADYPIEIVEVKENRVKLARIFPKRGQAVADPNL